MKPPYQGRNARAQRLILAALVAVVALLTCAPVGEAAYRDTVIATPGLVSYYRLGETAGSLSALDEKGLQNGSYLGVLDFGKRGALTADANTSVNFNDPADKISIPHNAAQSVNGFTTELWVYLNDYGDTDTWRTIAFKGNGLPDRNWMLTLAKGTQGRINYSYSNGTSFIGRTAVTDLQLRRWYHVAFVHIPGQKAQLFVNGALDDELADTTAPVASTAPISVASDGILWTNGRIDELAIYNQALTATQVGQHAAGGDYAAPDTTITSGPSGLTNQSSPSFGISSSESGSTFECRIDAGAWGTCTNPKSYSGLTNGAHTFEARALDPSDNVDPTAAVRSFTVDTVPADTTIDSGDSGTITTSSATWRFSSPETPTTFECRMDAGTWSACTSPKTFTALREGSHTVEVRSIDAAGNPDASPASRTITVNSVYKGMVLSTPGLVGYYRLGEAAGATTAVDESGTQNGTYAGTLGFAQPGSLATSTNTSVNFDAAGDQMRIPDNVKQRVNGYTVETWLYLNDYGDTTRWRKIAQKGSGLLTRNWLIALAAGTQGRIQFSYAAPGAADFTAKTGVTNLQLKRWYHIAVVHDPGSRTQLYINGDLDSELIDSGTPVTSADPVQLASDLADWTNARYDEFAIYDRPLSTTQIERHFEEGDTVASHTVINSGPSGLTSSSTATFGFSSPEDNSTFECRIDAGAWAACASPKSYTGLTQASHTFDVRAADPAGNLDATPSSRTFTVDTTAPDTSITSGPVGVTTQNSASLAFSSADTSATFECKLDAGAWGTCSSPKAYTRLSQASHTFSVRAVDAAGNPDATPATSTWTVSNDYRDVVMATPGLVSYYRLDDVGSALYDTAVDQTGVQNGDYDGTPAYAQPGALGNSVNTSAGFDASTDEMWIPDTPSHRTNATTVELWMYLNSYGDTTRFRRIAQKGSGTTDRNWQLALYRGTNGKIIYSFGDGTAFHQQISTANLALKRWYHVVYVHVPGQKIQLYVNGALDSELIDTATPVLGTSDTELASDGFDFTDARYDDFAIYNQVLTPTQISQHYQAGDVTPPNTTIATGPSGTVNTPSVTFGLTSSESDATFDCRIDAGAWAACGASQSVNGLADGSHTFEARAYDGATNQDDTPATRTFTVDTVAPDTSITSAPPAGTNLTTASIAFNSPETGATFECRLDGGAWAACTSPKSYTGLADGSHTAEVRAVDAPGNRDATPASTTWNVSDFKLLAPETVHSNGADLEWTQWPGAGFQKYEVHRSTSAGFTPSASTLIGTVGDRTTTHYEDTTAAAGQTFTYKVVAETTTTPGQTVTLPADGQARKVIQGDAVRGQSTYIRSGSCENHGVEPTLKVGSTEDTARRYRALTSFDIRDIPADATIASAQLSMYMSGAPSTAETVEVHRATSEWFEGSGSGTCTGDGASWLDSNGGVKWVSRGGDFASAVTDSKAHASGNPAGWDDFNVLTDVRAWVDASAPNLGLVLKSRDETLEAGKLVTYQADSSANAAQRPKLTIDYTDGSHVQAPAVDISSPAANDSVSGASVQIAAGASDDGHVEKVEFFVDGSSIGIDTSAPYTATWNAAAATEGAHTLLAKATDDAGNATNSGSVSVKAQSSAAPATRVMSPSDKYQDLVRSDLPVGYWRLGETTGTTAADISGNNRNATLSGSYLLGQIGLLTTDTDKSLLLKNGTTDGTATVTGLTGQAPQKVTAEAWVKTTAGVSTVGQYNRVLARNWNSTGGWLLALTSVTGPQQRAMFSVNSGGTQYTSFANVAAGAQLLHLVGTYDGSTVRLYVNGVLATTTATVANAALNTTTNVVMGQTLNNDMTTDEAAVYDVALSSEQAREHYDVGQARVPTVSGSTTVTADATDDKGVDHVDFYVDDAKFGEDASAPYRVSLNTLDPALPLYDGTHTITTKAYDAGGQETTSAPASVKVANTANTKYSADITETAPPQAVTYDPNAATQEKSGVNVTVKNTSAATWSATDIVLKPRWVSPDPTPQVIDAPDVPLGAALAPNATATKTVLVDPPTLPAGVNQAKYTLRFDVLEKSTNTAFADKGNKPMDNPVIVNKALLTALGLERFYHYEGEDLGAGMQNMVNVANGNSIVRLSPFEAPGRGLNTVVNLTYNSLEKKSESPIGNNFSLSMSSLTRFGNPIDIHPNNADTIAGRANKFIEFTDGDGSTFRFTQNANGGWDEPAGVHLYLRNYSTTDTTKTWAFTRPDRTTFFYDNEGYPTGVEDGNGNRISYTLQTTPAGEDPGGPKKRITSVTDAGGRSFDITYYSKTDAKKPQIRGKIKRITDHTGSPLDFTYYEDGNLLRINQRGGTKADGSFLADRTWVFTYTTSNGDLPAIPSAANRVSPDPKTPNQSTALYSVRDPRGNETTFTYLGTGAGQDRWKLASRTNRATELTTFGYDTTNRITTVTQPMSRVSKYAYDTEGKVTKITNPKNEDTLVHWTTDRQVDQITEPNPAQILKFSYNANGYLTDKYDELDHRTHLVYQDLPVDANDASSKWKTGRTIPHLSQLQAVTAPKGMETATVDDYTTTFDYDSKGNMLHSIAPEQTPGQSTADRTTTYARNPDGTTSSVTDANGHSTSFPSYDQNGLPTQITDAKGGIARFSYSADGLLQWIQDPNHSAYPAVAGYSGTNPREYRSYFDYDSFHRLGRQSAPKSTTRDPGKLIWSDGDYDANDNLLTRMSPHYGVQDGMNGPKTLTAYDAMDRPTLLTGPDTSADPAGERIKYDYDAAGRLKQVTKPKGVMTSSSARDYATIFDYDDLDRIVRRKSYDVNASDVATQTRITHYCYDLNHDLRTVTSPRANLDTVTCPTAAGAPFTTRYDYDFAHRRQSTTKPAATDAAVLQTSKTYDSNDNVETSTNENGKTTTYTYDQRNEKVKTVEPFNGTRKLTTAMEYDRVGNLVRSLSPRAWDATGGVGDDYATKIEYDELDRVKRVDLPTAGNSVPLFVYKDYDKNGNVTLTSLPTHKTQMSDLMPDELTSVRYFDPGWIADSNNPSDPLVKFDYTAEGWQSLRTPTKRDGSGDDSSRRTLTEYYPDGKTSKRTARNGLVTQYKYDADNKLIEADDASGVTKDQTKPLNIEASYDGFDRVAKTREREVGKSDWSFTTTSYDQNDNLAERYSNGTETSTGTVTDQGRRQVFTYDGADWLTSYVDYGPKSTQGDDRQVLNHFEATGWEKQRMVQKRNGSGVFTTTQLTDWTHFDNGKLNRLTTKNNAGDTLEDHHVGYDDAGGHYANGNRTSDVFRLRGPNTGAPCRDADCTNAYTYDSMDRLVKEARDRDFGTDKQTTYDLNDAGGVKLEVHEDGLNITRSYQGTQLTRQAATKPNYIPLIQRFHYDDAGNLDCVTGDSGVADDVCKGADGPDRKPEVTADYSYDGLNRIMSFRTYTSGAAKPVEDTSYVYDALSRPRNEIEKHGDNAKTRTMTYLGLSNNVAEENKYDGAQQDPSGQAKQTKTYGYDAFGHRITMNDFRKGTGGAADYSKDYSYATDVHGSVSLLIDDAGKAKAQYGYGPYGEKDETMTDEKGPPEDDTTKEQDTSDQDPLNPYRFSGKRTDSGSTRDTGDPTDQSNPQALDPGAGNIDMGARHFSPNTGRFLQEDQFDDAVSDLGLSSDPLTGDRYGLAGGNPISFIETDGHMPAGDGGGGASTTSSPSGGSDGGRGPYGNGTLSSSAGSGSGGSGSSGGSGFYEGGPNGNGTLSSSPTVSARRFVAVKPLLPLQDLPNVQEGILIPALRSLNELQDHPEQALEPAGYEYIPVAVSAFGEDGLAPPLLDRAKESWKNKYGFQPIESVPLKNSRRAARIIIWAGPKVSKIARFAGPVGLGIDWAGNIIEKGALEGTVKTAASAGGGLVVGTNVALGCEIATGPETAGVSTPACAVAGFAAGVATEIGIDKAWDAVFD